MKKYICWLLPLIWMGVIFYASNQPYEDQDIRPILGDRLDLSIFEGVFGWMAFTYNDSLVSVETLGVEGFIEFFIRKGAHVAVFFLLTCFYFIAIRKSIERTFKQNIAISFFAAVAYAITDEIHQGFTPNRTPFIGDVMLDAFGALAAVMLLVAIKRSNEEKNGFKRCRLRFDISFSV